jgi:excisionase family DNA binding protein
MDNEYLTSSEIADTLRVTRHTVNAWLISGLMQGYQVGTRWRVPRSSLAAFMQAADNSRLVPAGDSSPVVAVSQMSNRKSKRK